MTRAEKQAAIDKYVDAHNGRLTAADIKNCYLEIVNPGFRAKATHALKVCFVNEAERYIDSCFKRMPNGERLYDIRNGINHGDIDTMNPLELARINARMDELWMITLGMFGYLLHIPVP